MALALSMHALWPLATLARPSAIDLPSGVCSASGFRLVQSASNLPLAPASSHQPAQCLQCGLCASPLGHAALPAPALQTPAVAPGVEVRGALAVRVVAPAAPWNPSARPRAPPDTSVRC